VLVCEAAARSRAAQGVHARRRLSGARMPALCPHPQHQTRPTAPGAPFPPPPGRTCIVCVDAERQMGLRPLMTSATTWLRPR
jgi:hypothetical protein